MRRPSSFISFLRQVGHRLGVLLAAAALTLTFFIVLPLMQTISKPPTDNLYVTEVDLGQVEPPPPPPPEEEIEQEPEPEEAPPELMEEAPPLDISQLEMLLDPGIGSGGFGGADFAIKLGSMTPGGGDDDLDAVFSLNDLDQKPRVTYQPGPRLTRQLRSKGPAKVIVVFVVSEEGRVENPQVWKSDNPLFDRVALDSVKKWRFEPGKRSGKPVRFRFRVPIAFPQG
jgi:protein TonB